jgi:hypothetical protein
MAALNTATAPATLTDVDVELPMYGLARDLDLELVGDMRFVERAAAVGAGVGQGRLVDLVDLLGAGRLAVGLGAVILAGLAAGLLGLVGGRSLGERGGLALAGAGGLVELAAEALVLGLQVAEASLKGLAAGTRDGLHTPIIRPVHATAARPRPQGRDQLELDALNKYRERRRRHSLTRLHHYSPGVRGGKRCQHNSRSHHCARRRFGSLAGIVCCFPFRVRTTSVLSGWTATTRQNFSTD